MLALLKIRHYPMKERNRHSRAERVRKTTRADTNGRPHATLMGDSNEYCVLTCLGIYKEQQCAFTEAMLEKTNSKRYWHKNKFIPKGKSNHSIASFPQNGRRERSANDRQSTLQVINLFSMHGLPVGSIPECIACKF